MKHLSTAAAALTFVVAAVPVHAQDEPPLPPVGMLMEGVTVFACALIDESEPTISTFTFRRVGSDYTLVTEEGAVPAHHSQGVFMVANPARRTSMHVTDGPSAGLVGGDVQRMLCSDVTREQRLMLRGLSASSPPPEN